MPRHLLLKSMRDFGLPESLIGVTMAWHSHAIYTVGQDDLRRDFQATRGVRQGCSVAPLLWLMFVHGIVQDLYAKLGESAVNQALTLFADDHHWQRTFTDLASFEAALCSQTLLAQHCRRRGFASTPQQMSNRPSSG